MDREDKNFLEELVARIKRGDKGAIAPFVEFLGGPVHSFLRSKGIPSSELPGVVCSLFDALCDHKIDHYKPIKEDGFWNWLSVVMAHTATDWHRERAKQRKREASLDDAGLVRSAMGVIPPSLRMRPIIEAFEDALNKLGQDERDLLRLVGVGGLSYDQISSDAKQRGESACSPGALRVRVFRAKKKIVVWMKADTRVPESFWFENKKGDVNG